MSNEENLKRGKATQFKSGAQAAKYGSKGGKASARVKKEKRTIKALLSEMLEAPCKGDKHFERFAKELGLESEKSVKEMLTYIAILNTAKKINFDELSKLVTLLGESDVADDEQDKKQAELLAAIESVVKKYPEDK